MFYLYHSNDLELLKELLVHQLREQPAGPFEQETILIQSQGMSHWLKLQLAQSLGVTAQVEFPLPSKFIWRVFNALKPELPSRTHFDKQVMVWKLMELLPALAEQEVCAPIAQYLMHPDAQASLLKRYQLAHNIADTFDQYLIYRPHWLLAWEEGSNTISRKGHLFDLGTHAWQPFVWRALVESTPERLEDGTCPRAHRGRVQLELELEHLVQGHSQAFTTLPKRLFVFGIATLPAVYWQVLQAISHHVDVHFYLLNPCNEFAGEIVNSRQALTLLRKKNLGDIHLEVGNPLLASWGKLGREFLQYVQEEHSPAGLVELDLFYWDEQRTHMLAQLQQDIFSLTNGAEAAFTPEALSHSQFKQAVSKDDGSLRLVSAHSPLRELQRLYDQILFWFEQDKTLKPRDIVVMVPDINQYAPYIDAVFGSHKAQLTAGGEYRIPWAIADQSLAKENPIIESFLALLALPDSRFLNSDVMDWLTIPAIAQRFELTDEDLIKLQDWLVHAEVRWGLDGTQRAELGLPNFAQNSWRQGLKQLLLGVMLPDGALMTGGYQGDLPICIAEGNDAERLGKLIEFIDQLEQFRARIQQAELTIEGWQTLINDLLDAFYLPDEAEVYSVQSIRQALDTWQEDTTLANFSGELSGTVVAAWFNDHLGQQTGWQRFLAGPVNFCSLMPMRSIPFRAVCMLGMNDSDYPRRVTPMGFDLIHKFPETGDRARREDDRYLFLEAVCSAQDYLYLSYRGHQVRDNSEQQPSVLVAELKDYLANRFCLKGDESLPHAESREKFLAWLQESLPLQPYHSLNFMPEHPRAVPSFQTLWAKVAQVGASVELSPSNWPKYPLDIPADLDRQEVHWKNVIEALQNPPRFFVRRRLQAYLESEWAEAASAEPFQLNKLEEYQLKQDWLQRVQQTPSVLEDAEHYNQTFYQQQQLLGQLPVGEIGRWHGERLISPLEHLAQTLHPALLETVLENRALDYSLGETLIRSELTNAYRDPETGQVFLLFYRVGKLGGRYLLQAWLELLLASVCVEEPILEARYYGIDGAALEQVILHAPPPTVTVELLQQALSWYWRCWQEPIPHLPDALWRVLNHFTDVQEKSDQEKFIRTLYGDYGLRKDQYMERCLAGHFAELPETYEAWLEEYGRLMGSLMAHIQREEGAN